MAAGDTTQGRRISPREDGWLPNLSPGDYGRIREDLRSTEHPNNAAWQVTCPNGRGGCLLTHKVVEHEDGTITVTPSILIHPKEYDGRKLPGWHGYLERGVWREVP